MTRIRLFGVSLLLAACGASAQAQNYAFTTLAGAAASGYEDGSLDNARLARPCGVAVDASGNLYVADTDNHTIRRVGTDGRVTTVAGLAENSGTADGVGSEARFFFPFGVTLDGAGNLYVSDRANYTIRRIDATGRVTTLAGRALSQGMVDGSGPTAQFRSPAGIVFDARSGDLFVADQGNHAIRRVTLAGVVTTHAGKMGTSGSTNGSLTEARFNTPMALAFDAAGTLYVAEAGNYVVRKLSSDGQVTTLAGRAGVAGFVDGGPSDARFSLMTGLCVDRNGNVWVSMATSNAIRMVTPAGFVSTIAGGNSFYGSANAAGNNAEFSYPEGLAADASGNIYVADSANHAIRRVTPAGVVTTVAGQSARRGYADGASSVARFNMPRGVAVDKDGTVYVADEHNGVIRRISANGEVTTLSGIPRHHGSADGVASVAHFYQPWGLAVDDSGNVFVADFAAHLIRKVTPDGTASTVAGKPNVRGTDDGMGDQARFSGAMGIAVDRNGVLYVADTFNHTIRRISRDGIVATLAGSPGNAGTADGTGDAARFNTPRALAAGPDGNIYVADSSNFTVRRVTPAGVVSTFAGQPGLSGNTNGEKSSARFGQIYGIGTDAAGAVYVVDNNYYDVRKIQTDGQVVRLGGTILRGSIDGIGTSARFRSPTTIAVSSAGELYVADSENNTIRLGRPLDQAEQTSQMSNLSVRADLVAGQRLMVGLVMNAAKPVLVRAVGPGLGRFLPAMTPVVTNPSLELYNAMGGMVDRNDTWGGGTTLSDTFVRLGAFPLDPASEDAALLRSIEGSHTAHYVAPTSGTGIIEAYDAGTAGQKGRFSNVSARYRVGTSAGSGPLIAGFAISGTGYKTLLIRGIGPQLGRYGAASALPDPKLDLFNARGDRIAENDQWQASLTSAFTRASAFPLDAGSKDAALLVSLPPGLYSAQVSSADGTTGEAMIEVYELP